MITCRLAASALAVAACALLSACFGPKDANKDDFSKAVRAAFTEQPMCASSYNPGDQIGLIVSEFSGPSPLVKGLLANGYL